MYFTTIHQMTKMLDNLGRCLEKGAAHAKARSFDPAVLLNARLAPDQFHLTRQVQAACDAAKFAAARLAGRDPPRHEDREQTVDELRARVADTAAYLRTFTADDFASAGDRVVPLGWLPGKGLLGRDYLTELAAPNFYFHVTTAYSILRHNGVDLGKADFIGSLALRDV